MGWRGEKSTCIKSNSKLVMGPTYYTLHLRRQFKKFAYQSVSSFLPIGKPGEDLVPGDPVLIEISHPVLPGELLKVGGGG